MNKLISLVCDSKFVVSVRLLVVSSMLLVSPHAAAFQLSDIFTGIGEEVSLILPIVMLCIAALGIGTAGWAILSAIGAKRTNQPLSWQMWGMIGGAAAVIVPLFVLAAAGSLSGGEGDASSSLDSLGLDY